MGSHTDKGIFIPAASRGFFNEGALAMTKPFVRFVDDDENRILQDGETFNHRLMLRDSITKTDVQIALDATHAVKVRDAAILDAAHKPGFRYANVITDAQRARAQSRDTMYEASDRECSEQWRNKAPVVDATDDPRTAWHDAHNATRSAHFADSRTYDAATAQAAKDAAYNSYDADLQQQSNRKCGSQF
jgi:hypothetical protein